MKAVSLFIDATCVGDDLLPTVNQSAHPTAGVCLQQVRS